MAGAQAAHQVKSQLADKALQAAKAAEAALAGKQSIVEQLEQEVRDAEAVVQEEGSSLQHAQSNVNAAMQAAQQATLQVHIFHVFFAFDYLAISNHNPILHFPS